MVMVQGCVCVQLDLDGLLKKLSSPLKQLQPELETSVLGKQRANDLGGQLSH